MPYSSPFLSAEVTEEISTPDVDVVFEIKQHCKDEVLSDFSEDGMVIVHCSYNSILGTSIRIWDTTVLIDRSSGHRSRLLQAINIPLAPVWMTVKAGTTRFTLVFAALPGNCECFDLYEDIQAWGKFEVRGIRRNDSDVYDVRID